MNLLRQNDSPMSLHLALPPISIPKFNGEYLDWPRFHDLFVDLIQIPVFGQSKTTYSTELPSWWSEERLDRHSLLRGWLWRHLVANEGQVPERKVTSIRRYNKRTLHDTSKSSISTLKNLDVSTKSWDPILFYYQKKTRPVVSICTGNVSGRTNGNSNVKEHADVYWAALLHAGDDNPQPKTTLRHQSVHNEENYMICHLEPHHLRASSRFKEMDPKTRRQAKSGEW